MSRRKHRSTGRRLRRERFDDKASLHMNIRKYIDEMCRFLDQKPKPSDLAVQAKFVILRDEWMALCARLGSTSEWDKYKFNREFRTIWEKRYRRPENPKSQESEGTAQPLN